MEGETLLSSSTGPSRKQLRESENEFAIGDMRSPAVSASKLSQVRRVREEIHAAWLDFIAENPQALEAAQRYGSREAGLDQETLQKCTDRLSDLLEVVTTDGITLARNPCRPMH